MALGQWVNAFPGPVKHSVASHQDSYPSRGCFFLFCMNWALKNLIVGVWVCGCVGVCVLGAGVALHVV